MIYSLVIVLREEGLGYRKISRKLNQWGIKTHIGKQRLIFLFLLFLKENMIEMWGLKTDKKLIFPRQNFKVIG